MARTLLSVLSGCLALLVAGGGIVFLGWLLWWLWSRQRQEAEETGVEIELDAPPVLPGAREVTGLEEAALPPPEQEELLPPPEEGEAVIDAAPTDEPVALRTGKLVEPGSPEPIPYVDIEGGEGPDDLRVIEGIGPRIAGVLVDAGVRTFRDLAHANVTQIEEILRAADPRLLRLAKPDTWPEQAALAADGDWEGLTALTDTLKRGRRV